MKDKELFYEVSLKTKELSEEQFHCFQEVSQFVFQHQKDIVKANIILDACIEDILSSKSKRIHIKDYVNKIEKGISMKSKISEVKHQDLEKYTISGLWLTMCSYIVLLFLKEFLTNNYLVNFSVDILVAIVCFYITLHNLFKQKSLIQRHQLSMRCFIVQIVGFVVALFLAITTLKSPFDVSFIILVIAFLTNKKMFQKDIEV